MRLSIIIPTSNEATHLRTTMKSIVAGKELESIVVDGGSLDGTAEIARREGIKVLEERNGRAAQMNAGARAAKGDTLLFPHADTILSCGYADVRSAPALRRHQAFGIPTGTFRARN